MKVAGFTFIKNAVKLDYPVVEAITSILPLCDAFYVAVGNSEDDTLNLIKNIDPKIHIIETIWDDSLREGGRVLAVETDKAFYSIPDEFDWAFYIQGDEVMHEKYLPVVKDAMQRWLNNKEVEGMLFKYLHFYGSYDYIGIASNWYKHEVRIIRNDKSIFSYKDAQGFRKTPDEKLHVKPIDAYMYHYGWVKDPRSMQQKQESFHKLWHDDQWMEKNIAKTDKFDYSGINALSLFKETHPKVMQERITRINWKFKFDVSFNRLSLKDKFKIFMLNYFGWDIGYKNYRVI
ncbi:MAG: glycosyl transferase [Bacteroidetes bacterium RIFOXYA12_FULL_35_11]|nr:MAG: glycosyl transferase [Bacteroidetes bacterium GWF2_35_48]OFY83615.1 MAG: glycosyl transferase [Bacteroidetes bacterium RIFOXYA12_FULL_35_11]OFY94255.1 MAG: glycosyl transferase [Bacteroidetes bacterium RIFOXYB2_FULL_35_7]OFY94530.1 MAG: glycosyl transferase [Bacteroidetes bacterium RIFOXYC12_FULL_35_7]HBX51925.1 glycosyl transferase [Bacteroidales bacterium]